MTLSKIRILPGSLIDHIAAGEVVERPASVVKELLENALDAGATAVTVDLRGGGLERLVISDNGCGMTPQDARLCVLRHATSKLTCTDDLFHIETLGFRGEALSSIASVSSLRLVTRPAGVAHGYELCVEGGTVTREGPAGCPPGTQVTVERLFFNTPARRKFMRAPATEQAHIIESAKRVFLGARRASVCVMQGSRRLLDIPEGIGLDRRVLAALGRTVGHLQAFEVTMPNVQATGFVGYSQTERSESRGIWFFVNGRFVRDRHLSRAVADALRRKALPSQATVVAFLDVPPALVDVNVQPQKLEVRFAHGRDVFAALTAGLAQALEGAVPMPSTDSGLEVHNHPRTCARAGLARIDADAPTSAPTTTSTTTPTVAERATALGDGYFVCCSQGAAFIVHWPTLARHLALVQWRDEAGVGAVRQQPLLLPEPLDAQPPWHAWLAEHSADLQRHGFDIEPVGPTRFLVRAIPEALACAKPSSMALRFVEVAYQMRTRLAHARHDADLMTPCVAALEVSDAADVVEPYLADADLESMDATHGVVRMTPAVLRSLFASDRRAVAV